MSSETRGSNLSPSLQGPDSQAVPGEDVLPPQKPRPGLLGRIESAYEAHPLLITWAVLAVGMVAILLWASRQAEMLSQQRFFLVLATVGLAGICAWIIGWED